LPLGATLFPYTTLFRSMSNMWRWENGEKPVPFPDVPWALDMTMDDFPYPKKTKRIDGQMVPVLHAEWFWESGFNQHPIKDLEYRSEEHTSELQSPYDLV